jgi:hypothetical protein
MGRVPRASIQQAGKLFPAQPRRALIVPDGRTCNLLGFTNFPVSKTTTWGVCNVSRYKPAAAWVADETPILGNRTVADGSGGLGGT